MSQPPYDTEILGIPVTVVSDEDAEKCDFRVFALTSYFSDDVPATCSRCGATGWRRPYGPNTIPLICMGCFIASAGRSLS